MSTLRERASISLSSAILFGLANLPATYRLTDQLFPGRLHFLGCPTAWGQLIHTFLFGLVSFLTMGDLQTDTWVKVKRSFYAALIFFFLSSPFIYGLVGQIFGTSNNTGCPNWWGVLLHSFVYFLVLLGVMYFPPDRVQKVREVIQQFSKLSDG